MRIALADRRLMALAGLWETWRSPAGDARLFAFSIMGSLFLAAMFRDVFSRASNELPDLARLAGQHAGCLLHGISTAPPT